jgi:hypothetical protein
MGRKRWTGYPRKGEKIKKIGERDEKQERKHQNDHEVALNGNSCATRLFFLVYFLSLSRARCQVNAPYKRLVQSRCPTTARQQDTKQSE